MRAVPPTPPDLHDVAGNPLPPVAWTYSFDFDDGLQGWTLDFGNNPPLPARWVSPALEPEGPPLPDGQPSGSSGLLGDADTGGGGGSLYLPGDNAGSGGASPESVATRTVESLLPGVSSTNSFVLQVDAYVANLIPLTGFRHNGAYPGNHLELAGFCLLNSSSAMCLEGAAASASTCNGTTNTGCYNGYLRFQDFTGGATSGWVYPTCCGGKTIMDLEGTWPVCNNMNGNSDKTGWWDQWVTLYINYNYSKAGEVYVWAYIPWAHPSPNCTIANPYTSGWIEIARQSITTLHDWTTIQLSGKFSWTQGQWDNAKISLTRPCNTPAMDIDGDGDVDMDDFGSFQRCYTGPNPPVGTYDSANCRCFDRYPLTAPDNAIDDHDFQAFAACAYRAGMPLPPNCN